MFWNVLSQSMVTSKIQFYPEHDREPNSDFISNFDEHLFLSYKGHRTKVLSDLAKKTTQM